MTKRIVSLIVFGAVSALVFAGCQKTPEQRAQWIVDRMVSELNLTEEQQTKLEGMKEEILFQHQKHREMRKEAFDDAMAQMEKDTLDPEELKQLMEKHKQKMDEMSPFIRTKFTELHALLTPEQRVQLVVKMKELHTKFGNSHGFGHRGFRHSW